MQARLPGCEQVSGQVQVLSDSTQVEHELLASRRVAFRPLPRFDDQCEVDGDGDLLGSPGRLHLAKRLALTGIAPRLLTARGCARCAGAGGQAVLVAAWTGRRSGYSCPHALLVGPPCRFRGGACLARRVGGRLGRITRCRLRLPRPCQLPIDAFEFGSGVHITVTHLLPERGRVGLAPDLLNLLSRDTTGLVVRPELAHRHSAHVKVAGGDAIAMFVLHPGPVLIVPAGRWPVPTHFLAFILEVLPLGPGVLGFLLGFSRFPRSLRALLPCLLPCCELIGARIRLLLSREDPQAGTEQR